MVQILTAVCLLPATALAGPGAAASAAWRNYVTAAEARIDRELRDNGSFLGLDIRDPARARDIRRKLEAGAVYIQKIQENGSDDGPHVEDGLIHHWLGAIFIPGTGLDKVLSWIQDYDAHQRHFTDVERSRLIRRNGDTFEVYLRFVRKKIVSVRYDTYHTVVYRREDATHASSRSTATRIDEAGQEPGKDSGFLWAMNSYWRFIEEDNGVFVQCESISLSRSVPFGLAWLVGRYLDSVPRESLQGTLTSIRQGVAGDGANPKEARK